MTRHKPDLALFREQVRLGCTTSREFASIIYHVPSLMLFSLLSALLFIAVVSLLLMTRYKETEQARGLLESSGRVDQILAPLNARVSSVLVSEGETVVPGQTLALLSRRIFDDQGKPLTELTRSQLQQEQQLLDEETALVTGRLLNRKRQLQDQLASHLERRDMLGNEATVVAEQVAISARQIVALQTLLQDKAISRSGYDHQHLGHLDLLRQQHELQRGLSQLNQEIVTLREQGNEISDEIRLQELRRQQQEQTLLHRQNELRQQEAISLVAEFAGRLSGIAIESGDAVQAGQLLFSIQEHDAGLKLTAYVPSRVVAKLFAGQDLLVSYDAFNHLHYGRYRAQISHISQTALDPRHQSLPVPGIREPVFKVEAILDQDFVAGPEKYSLQPGLLLTAEFITAQRSLISFIFRPVLQLQGKVG